ncbi:MAG: hypothetical protein A3I00_07055 [Betaproteobacteria bacterium RIFCSPLOWO2_02_FULL_64_12]|nr:MAG: hypothetical protein A3I00_07055 [Betaproteobacteria bacterium RIFCSPLOWO2_02_FULL_64_12]
MIRFATFPHGRPTPEWAAQVVDVFRRHESEIGADRIAGGLTSHDVLELLASDLRAIGFRIERRRLVDPYAKPSESAAGDAQTRRFHFDVYHPEWLCCLAIQAEPTIAGDADYLDLVEPLLVIDLDTLCLAVPNTQPDPGGRRATRRDYDNACALAESVYRHTRVKLPYRLLLIGY